MLIASDVDVNMFTVIYVVNYDKSSATVLLTNM